jgi:hypothetical protein
MKKYSGQIHCAVTNSDSLVSRRKHRNDSDRRYKKSNMRSFGSTIDPSMHNGVRISASTDSKWWIVFTKQRHSL